MIKSELARRRELIKRKWKPEFRRFLAWEFWKFERRDSYRRPKGNDNKMRVEVKGYPPRVKVGYRTMKEIRGLHPSGLVPVVVSNVKELEGLDPRQHIVYIASTVSLRKKAEIAKAASERGLRVVGW